MRLSLFVLLWTSLSFASNPQSWERPCFRIFENPSIFNPKKIETLEELFYGFLNGLIPDLSQPSQQGAFEIYRRMRFGDTKTNLNSNGLTDVQKILKSNPELTKEPFGNIRVEVQERNYPVTSELVSFLKPQISSALQTIANLFQMEANAGYWKKIFQFSDQDQAGWTKFLDEQISPQVRLSLKNSNTSVETRHKILYLLLDHHRNRLRSEGKDIRPISQAMVDLIHTMGYHRADLLSALKSGQGTDRINAYRAILNERDRFAMDLGFQNHFAQVMQEIAKPAGVIAPSGVASESQLVQRLHQIEQEVIQKAQVLETHQRTYTVRHLSLVESPFRSCLGGSDCSSRTYFNRALDPNYHYFTITDVKGYSSGHITVVLGEAERTSERKDEKVKVAFVDKVQNVGNTDLLPFFEAVRRSVLEKGYVLALPEELGDHRGISNEEVIRQGIRQSIRTSLTERFFNFKPHPHGYSFDLGFSRAEEGLLLDPVIALESKEGVRFSPPEFHAEWKVETINLEKLVQSLIDLKRSPYVKDRLRYIPAMELLIDAGLERDPEFQSVLKRWISDPNELFQLRKQALLYEWGDRFESLPQLLETFQKSEQVQIIQNLLEIPQYREWIFEEVEELPVLLISVRASRKVRGILLEAFCGTEGSSIKPAIDHVLAARDLSDEIALQLIQEMKSRINSVDVEDLIKLQKWVVGTSLETSSENELLSRLTSKVTGSQELAQAVIQLLSSSDSMVQDFGRKGLERAKEQKKFLETLGPVFDSLLSFNLNNLKSLKNYAFRSSVEEWIKNQDVDPELKFKFLKAELGVFDERDQSLFFLDLGLLPQEQRLIIDRLLEKNSFLSVLSKRTQNKKLFQKAQFKNFHFHLLEGNSDLQIQEAPVTSLQWFLVMGETNHDRSQGRRSVSWPISWYDTQDFIHHLNSLDPYFTYRLPTESEWDLLLHHSSQSPLTPQPDSWEWVQGDDLNLSNELQVLRRSTVNPDNRTLLPPAVRSSGFSFRLVRIPKRVLSIE